MHMTERIFNALHTQILIHHLSIGGWFMRMELIEVNKFNLGAKGETLYYLWKCDVNFRDPQIQIHSSTFWHFYAYYTYAYPLSIKQLPFILTELEPSWSYGSWIYNYLCNRCLSPLKLWVWTPFMARCTR